MGRNRPTAVQGVLLLTVTGIVSQLIGFVYRILLSQMIGAENMGLYQLIMPIYSVLLSICSVGLAASVAYLSAQYQAVGNTKAVWQLRGAAIRLFFALAALPCVLILSFSDAASVYILGDARTRLGLLLLVPCLLLTGVENMQKNYFYGVGMVRPPAITELIEQIIRSLAVLALLAVFLPCNPERIVGLIVTGLILCEIFSALTQTILFRSYLGSVHDLRGEGKSRISLRMDMLRIAGPVGLTAILGNILGSANAVLVPRLLVQGGMDLSEAMSRFGVMFGMTIPMLFLPTAFMGALSAILAPKLSEAMALGREKDIKRRIRRAVAAANLILIPALSLLAVIGPRLGSELYKDARVGDHMGLLALGVLLCCWQSLLSNCLNGLSHQAEAAKIAIFTDVVQLGITIATVGRPEIGLRGFAWGYVISSAIGAYLCWKTVSRETGLRMPIFDWLLAPILASALAASCARLFFTVLLRDGYGVLSGGGLALLFGFLLYFVTLQAQGVSLRKVLLEHTLVSHVKKG